jgi:hypothetical protein
MDGVNSISAKAFRWIGGMEEIAATFEDAGSTPMIHMGAAETFQRSVTRESTRSTGAELLSKRSDNW